MLMIGISGTELLPSERPWLAHRAVCGVILFARNFASPEQLAELVASLRAATPRALLIAVDQEGGPVQRFRQGFTALPALARLGALWDTDRARALALAEEHAWLMAVELRALDIDLSFAPVLDLARGNRAIGERALHADPIAVAELGDAYLRGMKLAGMAATVKHFPGHGSVLEDTHYDEAVDPRSLDVLRQNDLLPFARAFEIGAEAVMMAHVRYPTVDAQPAGYSRRWIEDVLRGELGFTGVVFSDDIGMAAALSAGGISRRVDAHLDAGCDVVLVCHPQLVAEALTAIDARPTLAAGRIAAIDALRGLVSQSPAELSANPQRDRFIARVSALNA